MQTLFHINIILSCIGAVLGVIAGMYYEYKKEYARAAYHMAWACLMMLNLLILIA